MKTFKQFGIYPVFGCFYFLIFELQFKTTQYTIHYTVYTTHSSYQMKRKQTKVKVVILYNFNYILFRKVFKCLK